jgi:murein DD-endopeptidase MepM/ murein hydrolase activator NlpD
MTYLRGFRLLLVLALLSVVVTGLPTAAGAQTSDDVERERRELERARAQAEAALEELRAANAALESALVELNEINGELANLTWKTTQLRTRTSEYRTESDELRKRAESLVRDAYIGGRGDLLQSSLEATTIQDVVTRQLILDQATNADLVSITRLEAVSREMDRLQLSLADDLDRVAELRALSDLVVRRMDTAQQRADDAFARAQDVAADQLADFREAERLKKIRDLEEQKRKEGASGGLPITSTPGWQCPVPSGRFINDWGFPRSGGRTHKGTDIFADRGTHALATSSGTLRLDTYSLGGKILWLRGNDGIHYYYAHLDGYPNGIRTGSQVQKGQVIGFVGNTGNAITTSPHLHFQMHPGGGSAVNPYPTLAAHC